MSELLDPNDFIITRKRKKYKFAKFANADNCFEYDEWLAADKESLVGDREVVVEIGAGTGLFVVELAERYPENVYIAIDVKADRLQKGAYEAIDRKLSNVYFVRARADQITELFPDHAVSALWLTFSDPFPRKSSAGRRMTHPNFLAKYEQVLAPRGKLHIKHDNDAFFAWTLEQLVAGGWRITELSFDLHESTLPDDYKIQTTYEQRWLEDDRITKFASSLPPNHST